MSSVCFISPSSGFDYDPESFFSPTPKSNLFSFNSFQNLMTGLFLSFEFFDRENSRG